MLLLSLVPRIAGPPMMSSLSLVFLSIFLLAKSLTRIQDYILLSASSEPISVLVLFPEDRVFMTLLYVEDSDITMAKIQSSTGL